MVRPKTVAMIVLLLIGVMGSTSCEAAMGNSLSKKAIRKAAKLERKGLRSAGRNGSGQTAAVSPFTTVLSQILATQDVFFTYAREAFEQSILNQKQVKRLVKKIIKTDFKVVGKAGRKEFITANGKKKKDVINDYFSYIFQGGVLPVYL